MGYGLGCGLDVERDCDLGFDSVVPVDFDRLVDLEDVFVSSFVSSFVSLFDCDRFDRDRDRVDRDRVDLDRVFAIA